MADAGDLKSPARYGRVGSNPTSAIICISPVVKCISNISRRTHDIELKRPGDDNEE